MRIITSLNQNTGDWLKWRTKGLGASDAPAVMGVSPWTTRFELWAEKTEVMSRPEPHPIAAAAMRRGQELEPVARSLYIKLTGIDMQPISAEHDEHPEIRASLDGWNDPLKKLLEIKSPGKVDHATAVKGEVPKKYIPQIQQQFLVTGAKSGDYVSYDGKEIVIVPLLPDLAYMANLMAELIAFWKLVETKTPPAVGIPDVIRLSERIEKERQRLFGSLSALALLSSVLKEQNPKPRKLTVNR